jgi:hypothetical protein
MKNMHLIPPSVIELVDNLQDPKCHENQKQNYELRLLAIRDYCNDIIVKLEKSRISKVPKFNVVRKEIIN